MQSIYQLDVSVKNLIHPGQRSVVVLKELSCKQLDVFLELEDISHILARDISSWFSTIRPELIKPFGKR